MERSSASYCPFQVLVSNAGAMYHIDIQMEMLNINRRIHPDDEKSG
jgi:hypothetical protein